MLKLASYLNDMLVVDNDPVARAEVTLFGRYELASRRNAFGKRREFVCRTLYVTSDTFALAAPVSGPVGERVIATFREFGKLEGRIARTFGNGFDMRLVLGRTQRHALAQKIGWLERIRRDKNVERRLHPRTIPSNSRSTLMLADGRVRGCLVVDMSISGAAVASDHIPNVGDVLAVGKIIGRVVRVFPAGFAIRFIELQEQETLEGLLISP